MRVLEGLGSLANLDLGAPDSLESRSVVSVGVFDGVHLGHQRLLQELIEMGSELRGVPTVVTFANHPDAVLRGEAPPALVSLPHRLRLLRRAGVERTLVLEFNDELRNTGAEAFAQTILAEGLGTCGLLLGYDSAMGKNREGTGDRFRKLGDAFGFAVREAKPLTVDGEPVSSTRIRAAIENGDLDAAHRLLGRWPSAFGEVVHGDGRGHELGFPTANLMPQSPILPPDGVYAVQVMVGGETQAGVANLGKRPTFASATDGSVLEVHLLDWQGDLYGSVLEVSFLAKLRDEKRFSGPDELIAQIEQDVARARALLAN